MGDLQGGGGVWFFWYGGAYADDHVEGKFGKELFYGQLREIVGLVGEDGGRNAPAPQGAVFQVCEKFRDARIRFCIVGPSFSVFVSDGGNEVSYCLGVDAVFG